MEISIQEAMRFLAGRCDYANALDGQGFNATDTVVGHRLAIIPDEAWSKEMLVRGHALLKKYRGQFQAAGLSIKEPPKEKVKTNGKAIRSIWWGRNEFVVMFNYDPSLVAALKSALGAAGRHFDKTMKTWHVMPTPEGIAGLKVFAQDHGFAVTPEVQKFFDEAKEAEVKEAKPRNERIVTHEDRGEGERFYICFPMDWALVDAVKRLPNRHFNYDTKTWSVPFSADNALAVLKFGKEYDFQLPENMEGLVKEILEKKQAMLEASHATSGEIEIPGLGGELMPFQAGGVSYMDQVERGFIGDEMGLGKTVQALAFGELKQAFPLLVTCPASLKYNWAREAKKWLPGRSVQVLDNQSIEASADILIINYDILTKRKLPKKEPRKPDGPEILSPVMRLVYDRGIKSLVLDECHYVKNHKSARTRGMTVLSKGVKYRLALSGTPILNRPKELIAQLQVLDRLNDLGGFWHFAKHFCGAYQDTYGLNMDGATHLNELAEKLRSVCFIRREKKDVLKELPPKQRTLVDIRIDNVKEYARVEKDVIAWFGERAAEEQEFLDSVAHLPKEERRAAITRHRMSAEAKAERAEQLVKIEALKQVAARGKLNAVKEWVTDFLETGQKLVLFAVHKEIQKALLRTFPDAAHIFGDDSAETRQDNVDRFQNDPACNLILCSLQAAGVGLTLTAASNVAFLELGWTPAIHDQAEDRCHRIGQEDSVNCWYLLDETTIDGQIWALIDSKRQVTEQATQNVFADFMKTWTSVAGALIRQ